MNFDVAVSHRDVPEESLDASEAASYVAEMSSSLAVIARRHGLDALAYILEMAREEAQTKVQGLGGGHNRQ